MKILLATVALSVMAGAASAGSLYFQNSAMMTATVKDLQSNRETFTQGMHKIFNNHTGKDLSIFVQPGLLNTNGTSFVVPAEGHRTVILNGTVFGATYTTAGY